MSGSVRDGETPAAWLASRVRELRRHRRWSLKRLALASGVSRSMLSQVERGEANPTLGVTHAIAQAFGLSVGELVDAPGPGSPMYVVAHDDRSTVLREDAFAFVRALTPLRDIGHLEIYQVRLVPTGELRSTAHAVGTRETVIVGLGRATVEAGTERVQLEPGDCATYRADLPHAIANGTTEPCELILIDEYA